MFRICNIVSFLLETCKVALIATTPRFNYAHPQLAQFCEKLSRQYSSFFFGFQHAVRWNGPVVGTHPCTHARTSCRSAITVSPCRCRPSIDFLWRKKMLCNYDVRRAARRCCCACQGTAFPAQCTFLIFSSHFSRLVAPAVLYDNRKSR